MIKKYLVNPYFLAPMAGFTDSAFRHICLSSGAGLVVTEMVSVKGLAFGSENTAELLECFGDYSHTAVQLFGSEPEYFAEAVKNPLLAKFPIIDINMGCPVPKVVKTGAGSALLKNMHLASEIISTTVKSTSKPVTVKFRLGWDNDNIVAQDFARMCEDSGASAITVHGRTREQMYSGNANWDIIEKVAKSVNIPVIGNGDIKTAVEAKESLNNYGVSAVAIGRGALGNPWIFAECTGTEFTQNWYDVIKEHYTLMLKHLPESRAVPLMRGHLNYYTKRLGLGARLRNQLNRENDMDTLLDILKNCIN